MTDDFFHVGDVLGRYVVEGVLGEGGMGVVYRAHDPELDRRVALKVLRPRAGLDAEAWAEAKARLLREARAAAALSHAAIVTIFDIGEVRGHPFLAMELIDGRTLRSLASDPPGISLEHATAWLGALANALAAAHRAGIVHRDVKPENVMVRVDGQVKLLDLGIARSTAVAVGEPAKNASPATPDLPTLTGEGVILGTVSYMAPEQIRGEPIDGRADQFAWGVLAYEMLAGRLPWTNLLDPMTVVVSIVTEEPASLDALVPRVDAAASAVVMRALAKDKTARFASMDDLLLAWPGGAAFHSQSMLPPASSSGEELHFSTADTEIARDASSSRAPLANSGRRPKLSRARAPLAGLVALLLVAAIGALVSRRLLVPREDYHSTAASTSASAKASIKAVRLRDLPRPTSSSPEALAAYDQGIRDIEDGVNAATHSFEDALVKDPKLVAADLRITVHELQFASPEDEEDALLHYRSALKGKERLGERDQALLAVLALVIVQSPKDFNAEDAKLRALLLRWPGDVEIGTLIGELLMVRDKTEEARVAFEDLHAYDPTNVSAFTERSTIALEHGLMDAARSLSRECLDAQPRATVCLEQLIDVSNLLGECAEVERLANRFILTSPDDDWAYIYLFESQVAQRVPSASLDATVARIVAHAVEGARPWAGIRYPWLEAVWSGDFALGQKLLTDERNLAVRIEDLEDQLYVERDQATMAQETDDRTTEVRAAETYLQKRRVIPRAASPNIDALTRDATPTMLMTLARAHRISAEALELQLAAWRDEWAARLPKNDISSVWVEGYARGARTQDEAEKALAHSPGNLEPLMNDLHVETEAIGRVYVLANQPEHGLPFLERAAISCSTRRWAFEIPRARYFLGLAREKTGNVPGACAAYQTVLDVWGQAKPRSKTADLARARRLALRCDK